MKRTNTDGATVDFKYTEGNPGLGIPATVVGADEMNQIQEELALFIEAQGFPVSETEVDDTLLQQAMNAFVGAGGVGIPDFTITNNQGASLNVTGLLFDKLLTKSARILIDISRRTDTLNKFELGEMFVIYDPEADNWRISLDTEFDNAGVFFTITAVGQVKYTSNDLTGASYSGTLKMKNVIKIAI